MKRPNLRSGRLDRLGSAIFAEVAGWKREARENGLSVIHLDIGSPDRPPAEELRAALAEASMRPDVYRYPGTEGTPAFREAVAEWIARRFGVELDPRREILSLMGTQDGLAHLPLAITDPGDAALLPAGLSGLRRRARGRRRRGDPVAAPGGERVFARFRRDSSSRLG